MTHVLLQQVDGGKVEICARHNPIDSLSLSLAPPIKTQLAKIFCMSLDGWKLMLENMLPFIAFKLQIYYSLLTPNYLKELIALLLGTWKKLWEVLESNLGYKDLCRHFA